MERSNSRFRWLVGLLVGVLACTSLVFISAWAYTTLALANARGAGVYSSAEEGMLAQIAKNYVEPKDVVIIYAGTNSFDGSEPHVWYVIACVWGGHRRDGTPTGTEKHVYDQPGHFFLNTREGWVYMPEMGFPQVLGFWMKVFGQAGPGSPKPTHDWGSGPQKGCVF